MINSRRIRSVIMSAFAMSTSVRSQYSHHSEVWNNAGLGLPKFCAITPSILETSVKEKLTSFTGNLKSLEESLQGETSSATVIDSLEALSLPLSLDWGIIKHLKAVDNNDAIRAAHDALQGDVVKSFQAAGQSTAVYAALDAIRTSADTWKNLDMPQQRIVDSKLLEMKHSGVALPAEEQAAFNALQLEAAKLSSDFQNNVLDATKAFSFTVTDKAELGEIPEGARTLYSQRAVAKGFQDSSPDTGPWIISLDLPSYQACMQHVASERVREAVYKAYVTRASDATGAETDNTPLLARLLAIRHAMAGMLGYRHYAEMTLKTKMAGHVEAVNAMVESLREASYDAAKRDVEEVLCFAREHCGFEKEALDLWDLPYYSERLREAKYGFKEEELKVYFALDNVLTGLFSLAERLFGIRIESCVTRTKDQEEAVAGAVEVWHKDVRFFHVFDASSGAQVAAFYLDPFSRPENKNGGAWMDVCLQKSKLLQQLPVAYLICNGTPPTLEKPSLMTFREVETLFHEFGHGLQHMLTTVQYGEASGISGIEWDAVELPSQFMENWCYDTKTLQEFARHYLTGEVIPSEFIEKLNAAKNFQSGLAMLRQLYFGSVDMALHTTAPPADAGDHAWVYALQQEIARKYTVIPPLPQDRFLNSFGHIFAGGYAAGYYSYKWAEVMSADAFAAFEEGGLENMDSVRSLGKRFRDTVLSLGGGMHPSQVYEAFRGRGPTVDALLRHSGLTK